MSWKAFDFFHKLNPKKSCLDDQVGLATISAGVQRAGGTRQHPGSALDEALELRAASIEGGASGEAIGMGAALPHRSALPSCLSVLYLGVSAAVSMPVAADFVPCLWVLCVGAAVAVSMPIPAGCVLQ